MSERTITRLDDKILCLLDGGAIGELEYDERPGRTYECHLDVVSVYQRQGVGRAMMTELEGMAKVRKGMSLYSFCAGDNASALAFFEACGFRSRFMHDFYGQGRHAYFLWKPIGRPE